MSYIGKLAKVEAMANGSYKITYGRRDTAVPGSETEESIELSDAMALHAFIQAKLDQLQDALPFYPLIQQQMKTPNNIGEIIKLTAKEFQLDVDPLTPASISEIKK